MAQEQPKDYIEMHSRNNKTPKKRFMDRMKQVEQQHVKEFKPYDARNAIIDYEGKIQQLQNELQTRGETDADFRQKMRDKDFSLPDFDLEAYGDTDRFELLAVNPVKEERLVDGFRQAVHTGYNVEYSCKRGGNITVYIPNSEFEEHASKEVKDLLEGKQTKKTSKKKTSKKK